MSTDGGFRTEYEITKAGDEEANLSKWLSGILYFAVLGSYFHSDSWEP